MVEEMTAEQITAQFAPMASLYAKKARVMGMLDPVRKAGKNTSQNYSYMTAGDVKQAVQQAMAEVGLSLSISVMDVSVEAHEKGRRTTVKFAISLCDGDTGASETSVWVGQGSDAYNDDKGFNKASTSALKYFLSATFLVSSAEEDKHDADKDTPPAGKPAPRPSASKTSPAPSESAASTNGAVLSSKDKEKWPIFLKWAKDKFKYAESSVMVALQPVTKDGHVAVSRTVAMAHVLADAARYDTESIEALGKDTKLPDDVIAEALLVPTPEIPY